ncbi:MAG: hypothetical protein LBL49_07870 [Clostridiales Family XIII bacterium]|jgi:hypothetical protein|nr:hypothetical protein [Clostridiales Family XIII bacterium]
MYVRNIKIAFIAAFFLIIAIPLAFIDPTPGKISEMEQRKLQNFPQIFNRAEETAYEKLREGAIEFQRFFDDRIGFRLWCVEKTAIAKIRLLGGASGKSSVLGKDGWTFSKGFRYNAEKEAEVISAQIKVAEYYSIRNIDYYFVLPPAKSEVYPEYLPPTITPLMIPDIDGISAALDRETDVNCVNTKSRILEYKAKGKVFAAGDHHWSGMGSYAGYLAIVDKLTGNGYDIRPIDVQFVEEVAPEKSGTNNLGLPGIFTNEGFVADIVPVAKWDQRSKTNNSGADWDKLQRLEEKYNIISASCNIYENPEAEYGTLLMYGDSFFGRAYDIGAYFAEHFKKVIQIRINESEIIPEADEYFKPDIVFYERYGNSIYRSANAANLLPGL